MKQNFVTNKDLTHIRQKVIKLEDRSRRNNLRIDGIPESYKETWDDCDNKVQDLFDNKLGIGNVVIERVHRVFSTNDQDARGNKDLRPKTIVLKLLNYKDKVKVFRNVNKLKKQWNICK